MVNGDQQGGSGLKGKNKERKGKQKPKWKCFHYGKEGHIKKYYYDFLKKQKQGGNVTIVASSSNIQSEVLNVSSSSVVNEWILNSGCSFHMSPHIKLFQNFDN